MDFLGALLEEKQPALVQTLTGETDLSPDEAERFVPEAGSAVVDALASHGGELDLDNLDGSGNVESLLGMIDIAGLAGRTGLSPEKAAGGLLAVLPMILGFLGIKAGGGQGLLSVLGSLGGGAGDMLGGLGKLGGGLFGK